MYSKLSRSNNMNNSEFGNSNTKMKRKYSSSYVKYICLTICVLGTLYIKLRNEYEIDPASCIQKNNVYFRNLSELQNGNHPSSGHTSSRDNSKKDKVKNNETDNNDKRKVDNNQDNQEKNDNNNNKEKQKDMNKGTTEDTETEKSNKKSSLDYNNLKKKFTKEQMKNIIDSLEQIPPKNDLENIWKHALKTANSGTDKIGNELMEFEKKYGNCSDVSRTSRGSFKEVLIKQPDEFNERLKIHENDYTTKFQELINREHTLDELKDYVHSFLEGFENLINLLFYKYKIMFEQKNMEIPIEGTMYDTNKEDIKEEDEQEDMKRRKRKKKNRKRRRRKKEELFV
ncbi:Plasmodium exported protein (PHISTa), unknown, putative [Plasmodium sp.]|nr:Plasmodium exported protein (PHISTa), unknown, putative [Plasmodium sp.]